MGKTQSKETLKAKAWIRENPNASIPETCHMFKISPRTVSYIREELKLAGELPDYPHSARMRWDPMKGEAVELPESKNVKAQREDVEFNKAFASSLELKPGEIITRAHRRRGMEKLFISGSPDHKIRANRELESMDALEGTNEDLGPGPPLNLEDAIDDVCDMISALAAWGGRESVALAVSRGMKDGGLNDGLHKSSGEAVPEDSDGTPEHAEVRAAGVGPSGAEESSVPAGDGDAIPVQDDSGRAGGTAAVRQDPEPGGSG